MRAGDRNSAFGRKTTRRRTPGKYWYEFRVGTSLKPEPVTYADDCNAATRRMTARMNNRLGKPVLVPLDMKLLRTNDPLCQGIQSFPPAQVKPETPAPKPGQQQLFTPELFTADYIPW